MFAQVPFGFQPARIGGGAAVQVFIGEGGDRLAGAPGPGRDRGMVEVDQIPVEREFPFPVSTGHAYSIPASGSDQLSGCMGMSVSPMSSATRSS